MLQSNIYGRSQREIKIKHFQPYYQRNYGLKRAEKNVNGLNNKQYKAGNSRNEALNILKPDSPNWRDRDTVFVRIRRDALFSGSALINHREIRSDVSTLLL